MRMKGIVGAVALVAAITVVISSAPPAAVAQRGPRIGQPAPDIAGAPWVNSEPLSIDKLRGRVVFVEFWTYG